MGIDIETSKKWMDIHNKAKTLIPSVMDQATQSGDFSQVDRASQLMDRIATLGQHHAEEIQNAKGQDEQGPPQEDQPSSLPPGAADPAPSPSSLPQLDPQAMGQPHDGTPESTAHEAAKGAAKGIIEAQQESALPGLHYGPGDLKMQAKPGYAPGELSFKSDLSPWDEAKAQPASNLPQTPERQEAPSSAMSDAELENELSKVRKKPSPVDSAIPPISEEEWQDGDRQRAGEEFARNMGRDPVTGAPVDSALPASQDDSPSGETDAAPNIDAATPKLEAKYGGDGRKLLRDFKAQAQMSDYDREFIHRVEMEIGKRPALATIPKILAALTLGVGSALGSWITGKYTGGALIDLSEDQTHYDAQRAQIGREVYLGNKREESTLGKQQNQTDRTEATEKGKNSRLATVEAGKDKRLGVTETGKDTRQQKALESHERIANIRTAAAKHGDQMSISDKAELTRLGREYSGYDRTLMTVDPKVKAKADQVLDRMEEIIQKYREQGK